MADRIDMLQKMIEQGTDDPFPRYALALEYKNSNRHDEAIAAFETLESEHPEYLPMYLMAGQLLLELDRPAEARPWLEKGIEFAKLQGNGKAHSELEAALAECEED